MNYIDKNDIIGNKYGKLTVESYSHLEEKGNNRTHFYNCKCECGNVKIANRSSLARGLVKSCGCIRAESNKSNNGLEYNGKLKSKIPKELFDKEIWNKVKATLSGMKSRCYREYNSGYKNYGAKGVRICDDWLCEEGVVNFYMWSVNNGISKELSIDRIDVNGNYEPSNCRWATTEEQNDNKSNTVIIEYNGETKLAKEWAVEKDIPYTTILDRYNKGITGDDLFRMQNKQFGDMNYTYKKRTQTCREWAKEYKMSLTLFKKEYENGNILKVLSKEPTYRNNKLYKKIEELEVRVNMLEGVVLKLEERLK